MTGKYTEMKILIQYILFTVCLTIFSGNIIAQPSVISSVTYGGSGQDEGTAILIDNPERIILGARSFSEDQDVPGNNGGSDYWISTVNGNNEVQWSHNFGGFHNDDLAALEQNSVGQILAFGTTRSSVPGLEGIYGAWLMNIHPEGQMLWSTVFGGHLGETGVDLYVHDDDEISILVKASSPTLYGEENKGVFDFWLAKLTSSGTRDWSKFYGGEDSDIPTKMVKVPNGFLIVGYSNSESGDVSENKGGFDYWLLRVDNQGEILWEKSYGGSDDERAHDVVALPNGDFVVVGESRSFNGDRTQAFGKKDVWMIRVNPSGELIWEKSFGGIDNETGVSLLFESPDKLIVGGYTESMDGHLTGNKGLYDYWLLTTDLNGNLLSQMNYGGTNVETLYDMAQDENGMIYMVGSSKSNNRNIVTGNNGAEDLWMLKLLDDPEDCDVNFQCFNTDVGFSGSILNPISNEFGICDEACNVGSDFGPPINNPGCPGVGTKSAWYKVRTDSEAELINVTINTPEFNSPQVAVLQSMNCSSFLTIRCATGSNGVLILENVPVEPDTAYYLVVGDAEGLTGKYQLCVSAVDVEFCNIQDKIYAVNTSLGSPLQGPYQPSEEVTFCYELNEWIKRGCNGVQGIVPTFGPAWDESNFNFFGEPLQIDTALSTVSSGNWDWYTLGDVRYNFTNPEGGYDGGQGLPAGWYFINSEAPLPNDDPDSSYGDIKDCDEDDSMWKVCFTLKTKSFCETNLDATISMKTFSDGEIGINVDQSCKFDVETTLETFMSCCLNPLVDQISNYSICSGDSVFVLFESNLSSPVVYSWEVFPDPNVIGASEGIGVGIFQELFNLGSTDQKVIYQVTAVNQFCTSDIMQFVVNVRPNPSASLSLSGPSTICEGQMTWLRVDIQGTSPFLIQLAENGEEQDVFLTEDNTTFIPVSPTENAVYGIVFFEDQSCEGSAQGSASITVNESPEAFFDETICQGDTLTYGDAKLFFPGVFNIVLEGEASNGCDSLIVVDLEVLKVSSTTIDTILCSGQTFTIGEDEYGSSGFYQGILPSANGCDSTVSLFLEVVNAFFDSVAQTVCFATQVEFGGEILTTSGIYYDSTALTPTCDSVHILNLTVLDQIQLSETVIVPDSGLSTGSILINFQGGLPPYTYQWAHGSSTEDQVDLTGGNYFLTITDDNGCASEFQFFVPLVSATQELEKYFQAELRPNPVLSGKPAYLMIRRESGDIRRLNLELIDLHGKVIYPAEKINMSGVQQEVRLGTGDLPGGLYFIRLIDPESNAHLIRRLVVE